MNGAARSSDDFPVMEGSKAGGTVSSADLIVFPENRSAVIAFQRIAERLLAGRSASPSCVMLHGLPGTGKSRLCLALIRRVTEGSAGLTARVIAAADFGRAPDAPDRLEGSVDRDFVDCDLLVIEDLQFLPTRGASAVCQILDRRTARRKATVVCANMGPGGLRRLPQKLTSRLAAGLVVQVKPLSEESRRLLLESIASERGIRLTPEAVDWLAGQTKGGGARAILGLLSNLAPIASAYPARLGRPAVIDVLSRGGHPTAGELDVAGIVKRVASAFGVAEKELLGTSRLRKLLVPRQVAMYLAREVCGLSLPRLGVAFGRDHSTVLHACRKVKADLDADAKLAGLVRQLRTELS